MNTGFVGSGVVVTGIDETGTGGVDLMGTVFAVRDRIKASGASFFGLGSSAAGKLGFSRIGGADGLAGGSMILVGSGDVF